MKNMLRKLRKRLKERELKKARLLAAALGAAAVLAASPAAYADQTISGPSGTVIAVLDETVTVTPTGAISGSGIGIDLADNNTVISSGTVSGGTYGILLDLGSSNSVTITGGTVYGGIYGIALDGPNNSVTITGGTVGGGYAGIIMNGKNSLTVTGGTVTGLHFYGSGSVTIRGGLVRLNNGDLINGATAMYGGTVAANSSGGTYPITNLAFYGGALRAGYGASAGNTFTIGTLSGGGGSFYLNTNLASGTSDRISITNATGGSFSVYAANYGGTPADPYATVRLVSVSGTNAATFSGGGDVGAYRYGVAPGSALPAAYNTTGSAGDYYFYNTFAPSTMSRAAMGENAGTVVTWYGEMNEIKKRMGDLRMGSQSSDDFWVRTYAERFNVRPGGGCAYSQTMRGAEIGKDNPQPMAGGKKYTGFLLGTGRADSTYSSGGSGTTHSTYAGAYASWLRDDGSYVDLLGKYNWFSHRFSASTDSGKYSNKGLGLSAEIGKRFDKGNGVYIEPAAELAALWANRAAYTTENGLAVETPAARSLQLRLGVTVGQKRTDKDGVTRQVYGKAGWVNEYKGDSATRVDTASFDSSLRGHQWVTGLGYIEDNGRHQLYIDVEKSWGDTVSKKWGLNAGCRWKF
jgi:outer membrane autotransporter protein